MEDGPTACPNCSATCPRAAASCPGCGQRMADQGPPQRQPFPWLRLILALLLALPVLPLGLAGGIMALYGTQEPGIQNRAELYVPGFLFLGLSVLFLLGSAALLVSTLRRRLQGAPGGSRGHTPEGTA